MKEKDFLAKYGKWAVVTGASSGIGKEFARSLAKRGFSLIIVARRKQELDLLQSELRNLYATESKVLAVDLAEEGSVKAIAHECKGLEVGLLVASAGFGTSGNFTQSNLDVERKMLAVNCKSVLDLSYEFGGRFANQKRGGLILLSSLVAFQGVARSAHYSATKAYVQNLAEGLSEELREFGVDVLASAPGPVKTEFGAVSNLKMGQAESAQVVAEESLESLGKKTTVRPGFLAKFLETMLSTVPRWGRIKIMKIVMKGMTQHQGI